MCIVVRASCVWSKSGGHHVRVVSTLDTLLQVSLFVEVVTINSCIE